VSRFHTQEAGEKQYLYSRITHTHNSPGKGRNPNNQSIHEKQRTLARTQDSEVVWWITRTP